MRGEITRLGGVMVVLALMDYWWWAATGDGRMGRPPVEQSALCTRWLSLWGTELCRWPARGGGGGGGACFQRLMCPLPSSVYGGGLSFCSSEANFEQQR